MKRFSKGLKLFTSVSISPLFLICYTAISVFFWLILISDSTDGTGGYTSPDDITVFSILGYYIWSLGISFRLQLNSNIRFMRTSQYSKEALVQAPTVFYAVSCAAHLTAYAIIFLAVLHVPFNTWLYCAEIILIMMAAVSLISEICILNPKSGVIFVILFPFFPKLISRLPDYINPAALAPVTAAVLAAVIIISFRVCSHYYYNTSDISTLTEKHRVSSGYSEPVKSEKRKEIKMYDTACLISQNLCLSGKAVITLSVLASAFMSVLNLISASAVMELRSFAGALALYLTIPQYVGSLAVPRSYRSYASNPSFNLLRTIPGIRKKYFSFTLWIFIRNTFCIFSIPAAVSLTELIFRGTFNTQIWIPFIGVFSALSLYVPASYISSFGVSSFVYLVTGAAAGISFTAVTSVIESTAWIFAVAALFLYIWDFADKTVMYMHERTLPQ